MEGEQRDRLVMMSFAATAGRCDEAAVSEAEGAMLCAFWQQRS